MKTEEEISKHLVKLLRKGNRAVYIDFVNKYLPKKFTNKSISDMAEYIVKKNIEIKEVK